MIHVQIMTHVRSFHLKGIVNILQWLPCGLITHMKWSWGSYTTIWVEVTLAITGQIAVWEDVRIEFWLMWLHDVAT